MLGFAPSPPPTTIYICCMWFVGFVRCCESCGAVSSLEAVPGGP